MTRRMKIENIRNPEKKITNEDLEEYQNLLVFYGMYNRIRSGHIETISLTYDFLDISTISNDIILHDLNDRHIQPQFFICNTVVIERIPEEFWDGGLWYLINVGDSAIYAPAIPTQVAISNDYPSVTIPKWFIVGTTMNYFKLCYDANFTDMYVSQVSHDFSGETQYEELSNLPNDGSPIPYLLYPNTVYPELTFSVGRADTPTISYYVTFNLLVIY